MTIGCDYGAILVLYHMIIVAHIAIFLLLLCNYTYDIWSVIDDSDWEEDDQVFESVRHS